MIREKSGGHALVMTFGCRQNEADSDRLRGILYEMGYAPGDRDEADVILLNTCAVREHAELRVFGIIGALKALKQKKPGLIIGICGCMMQQGHRAEEILKKYPQVNFVLGTHTMESLPLAIQEALSGEKPKAYLKGEAAEINEALPVLRKDVFRADVTIMYGCNNFCTYCIVPYVRGRERSRSSGDILKEIAGLVKGGCKEIMLLGQNVNSYGKDKEGECDFSGLLSKINALEGDFIVRFMTSHPKDATRRLIDTIAACEKIERHLHLPLQSGSDGVLSAMNRGYTLADYKKIVDYAREKIAGLSLTSDIIVGFPGEAEEDFEKTLAAIEGIRFDMIYSFIYSRRKGTPAADMKAQLGKEEKSRRMDKLLALQAGISRACNDALIGTVQRVLVEGRSKEGQRLSGYTSGAKLIHFDGDESLSGSFVKIRVTGAKAWSLTGEIE